jgi:hypothetical protein
LKWFSLAVAAVAHKAQCNAAAVAAQYFMKFSQLHLELHTQSLSEQVAAHPQQAEHLLLVR